MSSAGPKSSLHFVPQGLHAQAGEEPLSYGHEDVLRAGEALTMKVTWEFTVYRRGHP